MCPHRAFVNLPSSKCGVDPVFPHIAVVTKCAIVTKCGVDPVCPHRVVITKCATVTKCGVDPVCFHI